MLRKIVVPLYASIIEQLGNLLLTSISYVESSSTADIYDLECREQRRDTN